MRVLVALENRFDRTADGRVWGYGALAYSLWGRYLDVLDEVQLVARIRDVPAPLLTAEKLVPAGGIRTRTDKIDAVAGSRPI